MKLYGNKRILNLRIPLAWKKDLLTQARKRKTTLTDILSEKLEKKFGSGKGKVYKPKCDKNALNVGIDK